MGQVKTGWQGSEANAMQSGGKYLKLQPGKPERVMFLGEPAYGEKTWDDGRTRKRMAVNALCMSDNAVRVLDCGVMLARQIEKVIEKHGQETICELLREGHGQMDTRYTCAYDSKPTVGDLDLAKRSELHDVTASFMDAELAAKPAAQPTDSSLWARDVWARAQAAGITKEVFADKVAQSKINLRAANDADKARFEALVFPTQDDLPF